MNKLSPHARRARASLGGHARARALSKDERTACARAAARARWGPERMPDRFRDRIPLAEEDEAWMHEVYEEVREAEAESSAELRRTLDLTQSELASMLGVHALTVSKWERGVAEAQPFPRAILDALAVSRRASPEVGARARRALGAKGAPAGLYVLLRAAFAPRRG